MRYDSTLLHHFVQIQLLDYFYSAVLPIRGPVALVLLAFFFCGMETNPFFFDESHNNNDNKNRFVAVRFLETTDNEMFSRTRERERENNAQPVFILPHYDACQPHG